MAGWLGIRVEQHIYPWTGVKSISKDKTMCKLCKLIDVINKFSLKKKQHVPIVILCIYAQFKYDKRLVC